MEPANAAKDCSALTTAWRGGVKAKVSGLPVEIRIFHYKIFLVMHFSHCHDAV
jgi:hypothetical protein